HDLLTVYKPCRGCPAQYISCEQRPVAGASGWQRDEARARDFYRSRFGLMSTNTKGDCFMRRLLACGTILGMAVALTLALNSRGRTEAAEEKGPMIAHNVYFSLKDNSPASKKKLVAACKKYLDKHPGEVFFAAGTLAEEFNRSVND